MKQREIRTYISLVLAFGVLFAASDPISAATSRYKTLANGAQLTVQGGTLRIMYWSPTIVRVTYTPMPQIPEIKSLSVISSPERLRLMQREDRQAFILASQKIKVIIDKQTGAITFLDSSDHIVLQEAAQGRQIEPATVAGASVTSAMQSFDLASDEGIYGLGQHQQGA